MIRSTPAGTGFRRPGITLTEILIAIMILSVGLVSLATLFPIGLLRLRDATRYTRSSFLLQSAACDIEARNMFQNQSFTMPDYLTFQANQAYSLSLPFWYSTPTFPVPNGYNPLIQDTQSYGGESYTVDATTGAINAILGATVTGSPHHPLSGPGLPFAFDPLWRYQTVNSGNPHANGFPNQQGGYYPFDSGALEARFGNGIPYLRPDPDGGLPSAHGLQRITTFNRPYIATGTTTSPVMPTSVFVPSVFVSQEDMVWQDPSNNTYTIEGQSPQVFSGVNPVTNPSPVVPDLNTSGQGTPSLDWRYSWMFTGQLTNASNASSFDGNILILENRPFGISVPGNLPYPQGGYQDYQVNGETVVEAVWGYSANIAPGGPGYGTAADHTVLLRWPATMADPVVRVGDWIADVTYERNQVTVYSRWWQNNTDANGYPIPLGVANPTNNNEWDNLPPQRCYWYQVQKLVPPTVATGSMVFSDPGPYRYMIVTVNQSLVCRTVLTKGTNGFVQPVHVNAALIAPNVINVIPQTVFVRSSTGVGQ